MNSSVTSPGSTRPNTPSAHANWRNPTLYISAATSAGARWFRSSSSAQAKLHDEGSQEEAADGRSDGPMDTAPGPLRPPWQLLVALAAISVLICYADRSNISTAIIPMSEQYGWDAGKQGVVLSAFFAGYMATQLLGGSLADRYGGKVVLTCGVAAWSLTTLLTPEAAALGVAPLVAMRVAMGLGEGVAFPAIHSIIARGVPISHQSTSVGVVTAASYAGTALAFGVAPTIIDQLGWPWVFYLFGASAVLWLPFWLPLPVAGPPPSRGADVAQRELQQLAEEGRQGGLQPIEEDQEQQQLLLRPSGDGSPGGDAAGGEAASSGAAGRSGGVAGGGVRGRPQGGRGAEEDVLSDAGTEWSDGVAVSYKVATAAAAGTGFKALLRRREVWAICIAQYTGSWGFYGLLTWLPTFFKDYYHVEISQLAGLTLWPYVLQGGVGAASGLIADKLLSRGWAVRRVRRVLQGVGMVGPAACMLLAVSPLTDGSPSAASAWVTLGLGLNALTLAGVSVSHLDIAPKNAGVVFGAGNTAATAAGLLSVPVTGWVLAGTGSWSLVFGIAALHYVVGALLFGLWVGGEVLQEDG